MSTGADYPTLATGQCVALRHLHTFRSIAMPGLYKKPPRTRRIREFGERKVDSLRRAYEKYVGPSTKVTDVEIMDWAARKRYI